MNRKTLQNLLKKYNSKTATAEEKRELEAWYETVNGQDPQNTKEETLALKNQIFDRVKSKITDQEHPAQKHRFKIFSINFAKAAVLLVTLSVGMLLYFKHTDPKPHASIVKVQKKPIQPGGDNATLTLADGSVIVLNKTADGQIVNQSGLCITKTKSGELVYTFKGEAGITAIKNTEMNIVSTPIGGQYHLILADGTNVWLNANSSIKFPAVFAANERKVEIKGEVYFEVFKNKAKPFTVNTDQSEIKVLGTHFNVNAYDDEAIEKTTLLEGSIELRKGQGKTILIPGKQALVNKSSSQITLRDIDDLEAVIAWKNGYFQFDHADLKSVMKQVSRWYNVGINYKGTIQSKEYSGKIPRKTSAGGLIQMLNYSGIKCKIENNQITVNP